MLNLHPMNVERNAEDAIHPASSCAAPDSRQAADHPAQPAVHGDPAKGSIERIKTTEMLYFNGHEFSPINIPNFMLRSA